MPVPAQTPHLVNNVWIVFIKDSAFSMLYDVYLRNFDVNDRQRKEYSVLWFRQMWKKLNDLAGTTHPLTLSIEDIENSYNPSMPLYGKLQFEAKIIYSRNDGKYYHILVVDSFNYTLPYTDYYGGKRVIIENKQYNTMKNTRNRVRLTESQLHQVIKESVKKVLSELDWKTKQAAADERQRRNNDVMQNGRNSQYFNKYQQQGLAQGSNYGDFAMMQPKAYQQQRNNQQAANDQFTQDYGYDESNMDGSTYTSNKLGLNYNGTGVSTTKARFTPNMSSSQNVSTSFNDGNYSLNASGKRNYNNNPSLNSDGSVGAMVGNNNYQSMVQNGNTKLAFNAYQNLAANNPQFDNANNEVMNYRNGNYEYIKDKGWQLKK